MLVISESMKPTFNSSPIQAAIALLNFLVRSLTGLEIIKLEFILKLKIKRNDWLLADTRPQQPINALYFEFETVLKFYNLEAWFVSSGAYMSM